MSVRGRCRCLRVVVSRFFETASTILIGNQYHPAPPSSIVVGSSGRGGNGGYHHHRTATKRFSTDGHATTTTLTPTTTTTTAMRDSYGKHSINQYSAHEGSMDLLKDCAERLLLRNRYCDDQDVVSSSFASPIAVADLGSADGSNSVRTMDVLIDELLSSSLRRPPPPPLRIVFKEHPSSDERKLRKTVDGWLEDRAAKKKNKQEEKTGNDNNDDNVSCEILMKSFYEPLFEPETIDLFLSHICLHWLDASDVISVRGKTTTNNNNKSVVGVDEWKRMHLLSLDDADSSNNSSSLSANKLNEFLWINERTTPERLKRLWKRRLADRHLSNFLRLRARELKPGGELLVVMVGDPHEFVRPPVRNTDTNDNNTKNTKNTTNNNQASPLTIAMNRCVLDGTIRKSVAENTVVPYYLRRPEDVMDALELANRSEKQKQQQQQEEHGDLLELVELRRYETDTTAGGESKTGGGKKKDRRRRQFRRRSRSRLDGVRELYWSIHGGCVARYGGATKNEIRSIRDKLKIVFDECYDGGGNGAGAGGNDTAAIQGTFLACVFRKRKKEKVGKWESTC